MSAQPLHPQRHWQRSASRCAKAGGGVKQRLFVAARRDEVGVEVLVVILDDGHGLGGVRIAGEGSQQAERGHAHAMPGNMEEGSGLFSWAHFSIAAPGGGDSDVTKCSADDGRVR